LIGSLHLGVSGLILANTIQNSLHAVVLAVLLTRQIGSMSGSGVWSSLRMGLEAAIGAGIVAGGISALVRAPTGTIGLIGYLFALGVLVVAVYIGLLSVLGVAEVRAIPNAVRMRFARRLISV
jgi:hypothetical protein